MRGSRMQKGKVIWITGLSGSGKSSLARLLSSQLRTQGMAVVMLDGDELRDVFGAITPNTQSYSREGRLTIAMQYARLCLLIAGQGVVVVIATISLFKEVHKWNRANLPAYFEVYLKVPVEELRRRDPKGIYRRFDAGELTHVAGLDLPIEEPENPDLIMEFDPERSVSVLAEELNQILCARK
jgi:adenylylsulfate kinase-like enzyme